MKAVSLTGPGRVELVSVPEPKIQSETEVKIRVCYVSICADDAEYFLNPYHLDLLGHEFSGVITQLGSAAEAFGFEVGDRVTGYTWRFCGRCPFCRRGQENLCINMQTVRGLQEYIVLDCSQICKVPDSVPLQLASLSELVASCIYGVVRAEIVPGDSVLILGAGGAGLILLQLCRLRGAAWITVSEPNTARHELCRRLGADDVIDPMNENLVARSMLVTDGIGYRCVIDASKNSAALSNAVSVLSRGGTFLLFSLHSGKSDITMNLPTLYAKELTVRTSYMAPYLLDQTMEMLPRLNLEALRSKPFPIERAQEAYDAAAKATSPRVFIEI